MIAILAIVSHAAAEKISLDPNIDGFRLRASDSNDTGVTLELEIGAFDRHAVEIGGVVYYTVTLDGESSILEAGLPALPSIRRSVIIPDDARMEITVLESEYTDLPDFPVVPSKGHTDRPRSPSEIPFRFGPVYELDEFFPNVPATDRGPFILRDFRGLCVAIHPFHYNPVTRTLRVYRKLTIRVHAAGPGTVNILADADRERMDGQFQSLYESHFLNGGELRYSPVTETGEMLIITYDEFRNRVDELAEWKNRIGVKTTVVDVSAIGNDTTSITAFLQSFYDSTDLAYLLLVGDAEQIAYPVAHGGAADPRYALLAGDDSYPDVFVGRLSVSTSYQARIMIDRILEYEGNPEEEAAWYHRAIGIGSDQGPGDDGEYDYEHIDRIRDQLLDFTYTDVDQVYDPGATADQVSDALNEGRSLVNYCGHGSFTNWGTSGFGVPHINALTNANRLPFVFSVGCVNGDFPGHTCFAEAWLRATDSGEPTGAIGVYASSITQYWDPPMAAQDECNELLIEGGKRTLGGLCFNGACRMIDEYGAEGEKMFDGWHLFGDPSLPIRTDTPDFLAVDHAGVIDRTASEFPVVVEGIEGALCALTREGDLLGSARTGPSGAASIPLTAELTDDEELTLTVTAFNAVPYEGEVEVVPHPTCDVEPDRILVSLVPGAARTVEMTIANNGEEESVLAWEVDVSSDPSKSIGGSSFVANLSSYEAGMNYDLLLAISNLTPDYEWIKKATVDFPPCVTVHSSSDFVVVGESRSILTDSTTGEGAEITWNSSGAWGEIHQNEIALASVNVSVGEACLDTIRIEWSLQGDGWGDPPHVLYGEILLPPAGPVLLLHAPNGGETWEGGEPHAITWASSGEIGEVALSYSHNDGEWWTPIDERTANDGHYSWIVPETPSQQCLVRVRQAVGDAGDESDGHFRIRRPVRWITVTPSSGSVEEGDDQELAVEIDATGLADGSHEAFLVVANNGGDPVVVPVSLLVTNGAVDPTHSRVECGGLVTLAPGGDSEEKLTVVVTVRNGEDEPIVDLPPGAVALHASGVSSIGHGIHFCSSGLNTATFLSEKATDPEGRVVFDLSEAGGCGAIQFTATADGIALADSCSAEMRSPDLNGNGLVNFEDLFLFLGLLNAGIGECGNFDGDPAGIVNFFDTSRFLIFYSESSSCP